VATISKHLKIDTPVNLQGGRMILGFSGWMDGGDVSTGTVEWLVKTLGAQLVGRIDPEGFYIYNFPGSMEIATLFRPHVKIAAGEIQSFQPPSNRFFCDATNRLILFNGHEPNVNWRAFAASLFAFAARAGVDMFYFVGSVGGAVAHSREPRVTCTVSEPGLKSLLEPCGVKFTQYEGPGSFTSYLMSEAADHGVRMANLVVEVPAYVQGTNPKSIEVVVRKLTLLTQLPINLDPLRALSEAWEKRVNDALHDEPELAKHIDKLEEDYDNEVFDTQMGDLKDWLEQRGIRVD